MGPWQAGHAREERREKARKREKEDEEKEEGRGLCRDITARDLKWQVQSNFAFMVTNCGCSQPVAKTAAGLSHLFAALLPTSECSVLLLLRAVRCNSTYLT